jgi:hypothetical protein
MITGKIARIVSDKEVILNVGLEDDVKKDMKFVIYSEGDHIFDPDTGEDLGAIETIKGRIVISHVMEKMSRAITDTYQVRIEDSMYLLLTATRTQTKRYTLEVNENELLPIKEDLTVKVGDNIRSI